MFATTLLFFLLIFPQVADEDENDASRVDIDQVVLEAFLATHDGYSSDEVILNDELNQSFLTACRSRMPSADAFQCNWKLMNLRKAGKLKSVKTTKRGSRPSGNLQHVAEIASRTLMDRHSVSIDNIMADPKKRSEFNRQVQKFAADANLYLARKSAFQLRKARRLRPELIIRIADWGRKIDKLAIDSIRQDIEQVPDLPGVYLFQDETGYLYIGQAENLRDRLKQHLSESSNAALLEYLDKGDSSQIFLELHSFPEDSRAKELMVRRAYESELIRSRKPKFNILP